VAEVARARLHGTDAALWLCRHCARGLAVFWRIWPNRIDIYTSESCSCLGHAEMRDGLVLDTTRMTRLSAACPDRVLVFVARVFDAAGSEWCLQACLPARGV
jgi:hypothetical protein